MLILLGGGFIGLMILPYISVPSTRGGTLAKPVDMIKAAPKAGVEPIFSTIS